MNGNIISYYEYVKRKLIHLIVTKNIILLGLSKTITVANANRNFEFRKGDIKRSVGGEIMKKKWERRKRTYREKSSSIETKERYHLERWRNLND